MILVLRCRCCKKVKTVPIDDFNQECYSLADIQKVEFHNCQNGVVGLMVSECLFDPNEYRISGDRIVDKYIETDPYACLYDAGRSRDL